VGLLASADIALLLGSVAAYGEETLDKLPKRSNSASPGWVEHLKHSLLLCIHFG